MWKILNGADNVFARRSDLLGFLGEQWGCLGAPAAGHGGEKT
jgi:hypothetical protein